MQVPALLQELIQTDRDVASFVDGALARFEPWVGNSQMPLFPEYTDHSLTHVAEVMKTAVDLSTAKARKLLSAKDAGVLVLATCLHDAAMHLTEDGFVSLVRSDSLWRPIEGFNDQPWDVLWQDFFSDARRFDGRKLLALFGDTEPIGRPAERVTDLTKRDRLLMGEFVRRHHARLAHEIALYGIPGPDGRAAVLIDQSSELGGWIADLAGVTARSHGMPIRNAIGYLQRNYHVRDFNGVHAVFLMVLVRIADYLQIQAKRAPTEVLEVRKLASPVSQGEWKVHASIRNITRADDDPEALLIDARPLDVKSYLRVREWLDGIQSELDTSWAVLGEVYGRYKQEYLNELGIELRRVRSNFDNVEEFARSVNYVPAQVSFEAANPDLLKLLVGPLYSDRPQVGLRELIQNAVDAVREINDFLLRRTDLHDVIRTEQETDVEVVFQCEKDPDFSRSFIPTSMTISDRGIGMSLDIVQNYFLKAGASFRRSDAWRQQFEDEAGCSKVLRSGRFGVGALAAFLIGDRIEVTSRHVESPPDRGISFQVSIDDESVLLKWVSCAVGTTILVPIPSNRRNAVKSAFGLSYVNDERKIDNTDGFSQYISSQPSVGRILKVPGRPHLALMVTNMVPSENDEASLPWRFFNTEDYSGVFWTYDEDFPALVCNGILVAAGHEQQNGNLRLPGIRHDVLVTPRLVIYDRDGKLPLNLQRTTLTTPDFKLSSALLADVVDDLISYALVDGPEEIGSRGSLRWLTGKYEGFGRGYFKPKITPHRWFVTRSGFGLVDPGLACLGDVSAFVIAYSMSDLTPEPQVSLHEYLGIVVAHLEPDLRLMLSEGLHYSSVNDIKLMARSLLSDSNFYELLPNNLADWKVSGRRVFIRKSLMANFEANATFGRWLRNIVSDANVETDNDDWVVLRYGTCPAQQVLRQNSPVLLQAKETSIVSIVECYPVDTQAVESLVAERWMKTLGLPIIPFDQMTRNALLSQVFEELRSHVDLWRANVGKDCARSDEDLIDAEETLEADGLQRSSDGKS